MSGQMRMTKKTWRGFLEHFQKDGLHGLLLVSERV